MGFFSWKTSDTQKSIINRYGSKSKRFTVHMITEDGQIFTEKEYEGYGVFGGKDVYVLICEMNNLLSKTGERSRIVAIDLMYKTQLTNGTIVLTCGEGEDFTNWEKPIKRAGGKTANQLVQEGWSKIYPYGYGKWNIAATKGIKLPKFVKKLPKKGESWKEFWDKLPYPEDCPNQGMG